MILPGQVQNCVDSILEPPSCRLQLAAILLQPLDARHPDPASEIVIHKNTGSIGNL